MPRQIVLITGLLCGLLLYFVALDILSGDGLRIAARFTSDRWGAKGHNQFLFELASEGGLGPNQISHGTAFNISGNSTWLTARHVVSPCLLGKFHAVVGGALVGAVTVSNQGDIAQLTSIRTRRSPLPAVPNFTGDDYATRGIIVGFANENLTAVAVQQIGLGSAHSRAGEQSVSVWV